MKRHSGSSGSRQPASRGGALDRGRGDEGAAHERHEAPEAAPGGAREEAVDPHDETRVGQQVARDGAVLAAGRRQVQRVRAEHHEERVVAEVRAEAAAAEDHGAELLGANLLRRYTISSRNRSGSSGE